MKKSFWLSVFIFLSLPTFSQNIPPNINDLWVVADTSTRQISIYFNLIDLDSEVVEISVSVSDDGGKTFLYPATLEGDIGLTPNLNETKTIQWNYPETIENISDFKIKIVADDFFEIDIQELVDQVSVETLQTDLETIVGVRHFNAGAEHLQATKDFIEGRFVNDGLQFSIQDFEFGNYTAQNLIGRLAGTTDETKTFIIDGHYDTVANSPGADDNGTAVAGVLEAARILSQYHFKKNIKFVAFDLEELGLLGANEFVNNGGIDDFETIEGVINFEMIGYYDEAPNTQSIPFGFDLLFGEATAELNAADNAGIFLINVGNTTSTTLLEKLDTCASIYVPELQVVSLNVPGNGEIAQDLRRSDHAVFWDAGMSALMLTDGADTRNPYYHTPNDDISTINFDFMANIVKAAVATVADLAEIQHSTVIVSEVDVDLNTAQSVFNNLNQRLYISPNPNNGNFNIFTRNRVKNDTEIEILNANGQLIMEKILPQNQQNLSLNLNDVADGIYYVKMITSKTQFLEKVVVVR